MKYLLSALLIGGVLYFILNYNPNPQKKNLNQKELDPAIDERGGLRDEFGVEVKTFGDAVKESKQKIKETTKKIVE